MPQDFNRSFTRALLAAVALGACTTAFAQGPGGPRPRLVLQALDLDHDGNLSAQEIQAASTSLLALDRDGDGQLNGLDELSPRRQDAGADPDQLVKQLMNFDRNADGVLTAEELPERMQSLFARADANKDGKLTPEEIKQSAARTGGPRGRASSAAEAGKMLRLDPVIDVLDADKDGNISADEIKEASAHLSQLDKNHDGTISADEMPMRQQSPAERAAHMLDEFDTNKDGKLSKEEVPDGLQARFAEADKNGDGFLDKAELEQMPAGGPRRGPEGNAGPGANQPKGPNQ